MEKPFPEMSADELKLRQMLAIVYSHGLLYSDDGELQDNRELPFIDFRRDSTDEIAIKMRQRTYKELEKLNKAAMIILDPTSGEMRVVTQQE